MNYTFLKSGIQPDRLPDTLPLIPRKLWQTTKNRQSIKPELQKCIDTLKATNPDWQYHLFDDTSQLKFLESVCSQRFLKAYHRIQPKYGAARADMFRYVVTFLHGGAYMDLKSGTTKPLDDILKPDDQFIISQWDNGPDGMFPTIGTRKTLADIPGGEYEQWFVISTPGHPYLATVIEQVMANVENYNPYRFGHGSKGVLNVFGPNVYTRTIRKKEHLGQHRKITAWTAGIRYTMFDDLHSHQMLDTNHHGRFMIAPVSAYGLKRFVWAKYWMLEITYWPFSYLRQLNHKRLHKRNLKKLKHNQK